MAEVGPDGNVWVIDWYNYIVQHNPTPIGFKTGKGAAYETDLRDKKHGRIYRVIYDGDKPAPARPAMFSLQGATPERLVATLAHPNLFWRRHAQRLLVERGQRDVVPALFALVRDPRVDELGLNVGAIHALWTMHGLDGLDGSNSEATAVVLAALAHPSPGVRRNALQVLPNSPKSVDAILKAKLLLDANAQVRLTALLALADQPSSPPVGQALMAVIAAAENRSDPWITDAAICAGAKNSEQFLWALASVDDPSEKLISAAAIVAEHRARTGPFFSVDLIVAGLPDADARLAEAVVHGLAKGWPKERRPALNPRIEADLTQILEKLAPEKRATLVRLAARWGSKQFEQYATDIGRSLEARMHDESLPTSARIDAAGELIEYRADDADAVQSVLPLITPRTPPEVAVGLLRVLVRSEASKTGTLIVQKLAALTPLVRPAAVGVLLGRASWTATLLDHAERGEMQLAELSLDQQQALADHPDAEIKRRAKTLLGRRGALPNADRKQVLEELLPVAKLRGDSAAGKLVFLKQCAKCHVHGGDGQRVGPDLTGIAVHPKEEVLGNILDPSRSFEGNFRVYTLSTTSGKVLTGLLASESKTAIELFDVEGKKTTVLREDIDELAASSKSLMPEGFEKQISRQELGDLLEFLALRGKYLPLPLDRVATATSTRGMFYRHDAEAERLIFEDWKPKTFAGVPFQLVDPQEDRVANLVLLYSPQGPLAAKMPKNVVVPCNAPAKTIHLLSGVSGWGHPLGEKGSVSMIVRLHYANGETEDHPLKNGEHFADYIRRVDVPESQFAFDLAGRQIRYLAVEPKRQDTIERIELAKGPDETAPVVMAVTIESP